MTKVALITGANAMDSKSLARFLQYKDYKIVLTYRRNSLFSKEKWFSEVQIEPKYADKIDFCFCDITDQNSVSECIKEVLTKYNKIDELYMIGAMSHVGESFRQRNYSIIANGQSYYYFLEELRNQSPTTKVYGALTSELAGNVPDGTFFNEQTQYNPKSPYAIGKHLGANWIRFYRESQDSKLFACYGILFNHSNNFRSLDFLIQRVCNAAASISLGMTSEIKLGNLEFYRDEHWSDFGVEMMWKMLQNEKPKDYVIGTGETHHGTEYLDLAFGFFNLDWKKYVKIDQSLIRPNEVVRLIADSSLAQKELGWNPKRMSFKQHISEMCSFQHQKLQSKEVNLENMWLKYS